ncbi:MULTISPECIES: hybrid sensor histidine kinase/response regulator transcription factor [Kordiimonas]|jgi:signal transduction histidine kinase/DNA-binding response OmpR family regulator|uniref:hybrid sensor histidine kinase/response regulator transcription factor n=1 Tax=Kordiimonas TaxID=288021 RepID=UPI002579EBFD|nr:hybrid sensor histidine kinase/response regulator transcription factor [Kordiimonas sp. UBA4487]
MFHWFVKIITGFLIFQAGMVAAFAGQAELGRWPITNYTWREIDNSAFQIWDVGEDARGIKYFASQAGLFEFDGIEWRRVSGGSLLTTSVHLGDDRRVYVGKEADFGYIRVEENGVAVYRSLFEDLGVEVPFPDPIWSITSTSNAIFFTSNKYLFRYDGSSLAKWKTLSDEGRFYNVQVVGDDIYVYEMGAGLLRFSDNELTLVPGGDAFKNIRVEEGIARAMDGGLIVPTTDNGLVRFLEGELAPFSDSTRKLFSGRRIKRMLSVPSGHIIATRSNGLVFVSAEGGVTSEISADEGLLDNNVTNLSLDKNGQLWVASSLGVSRVVIPTGHDAHWTSFSREQGLFGYMNAILRFEGRIFVSTSEGAFYLPENPGLGEAKFKRLPDLQVQTSSMATTADRLLISHAQGISVFNAKLQQVQSIQLSDLPYELYASPKNPDIVFVGLYRHGLAVLKHDKARATWDIVHDRLDGIDEFISTIAEDAEGHLWLSGNSGRVFRLSFANGPEQKPHVDRFDLVQDFGAKIRFFSHGESLVFAPEKGGAFIFDKATHSFKQSYIESILPEPRNRLMGLTGAPFAPSYAVQAKPDANDWRLVRVIPSVNGNKWLPFLLPDNYFPNLHVMYPEADQANDVIWLGGFDTLMRIEIPRDVTKLRLPGAPAAVFREAQAEDRALSLQAKETSLECRCVTFKVAAPGADTGAKVHYQHRLVGNGGRWEPETRVAERRYENLPTGSYVYEVRAIDGLGQVGPVSRFHFSVPPFWYQTKWAIAAYFLLLAVLVWVVSQWRSRQLRRRNLELSAQVAAKTRELSEKNEHLALQNEMKSRFFTNLSHEFRTPLTLNLGPIEDMLDGRYGPLSSSMRSTFKIMHRNARRLLYFINQLLELAKMESTDIKLEVRREKLLPLISESVSAFMPLATSRTVTIINQTQAIDDEIYCDAEQLRKVFDNLLSNALKFSPDYGSVWVKQYHSDDEVFIEFRDMGPGIPANEIDFVFDRFYQAKTYENQSYVGTGVGLSLAKEIVVLHGGKLTVESQAGEGCIFTVALKKGYGHFAATQLVDTDAGARSLGKARQLDIDVLAPHEAFDPEIVDGATDLPVLLIAEDNTDLRNYLADSFSGLFQVIAVDNGLDALEVARTEPPAIIISDITMPKMDGKELCRELKANLSTSHVPVIMLTAQAEGQQRIEGLECGADDYLSKPFSTKELHLRVRNRMVQQEKLKSHYKRNSMLEADRMPIETADDRFLQKMVGLIDDHIADSEFGVNELAKEVGLSRRQLLRKTGALLDLSPSDLMRHRRLERAKAMLEQNADTVSQIAYAVGFESPSSFSKQFKQHFGKAPSSFRGGGKKE